MFKLPAQKKYLGKIKLLNYKQASFDNFLWQLDDPDKIYSQLKLGVLLQNKFTLFNFRKSINTKNFKIFMQFKILCYAEPIDAVKSLILKSKIDHPRCKFNYQSTWLLGFQFILIFRNFGDNQVLEDGMMCTCSRNGNQCKI